MSTIFSSVSDVVLFETISCGEDCGSSDRNREIVQKHWWRKLNKSGHSGYRLRYWSQTSISFIIWLSFKRVISKNHIERWPPSRKRLTRPQQWNTYFKTRWNSVNFWPVFTLSGWAWAAELKNLLVSQVVNFKGSYFERLKKPQKFGIYQKLRPVLQSHGTKLPA